MRKALVMKKREGAVATGKAKELAEEEVENHQGPRSES